MFNFTLKLRFKILFFLSLIFVFIIGISVYISIHILVSNQQQNISKFKNEFINSFSENAGDSVKSFFERYDRIVSEEYFAHPINVERFLSSEKEFSAVLFDYKGSALYCSVDNKKIIESLMPEKSFRTMIKNNLITEKGSFRIDNFNTFLKEQRSETIPTVVYFKIYENPNVVLGCVKSSTLTSVRIRYIQRMNDKDVTNYLVLFIVVFFTFYSFVCFVILFFIKKILLNPISVISEQIRNVKNGNYENRVEITTHDEIGELGISFNVMAERIHQTLLALKKEIKERENAERLLSVEKEELDVTLKSIGDGVITTDKQGNVVLINYVAEHLTGWNQKDAYGKKLEEIFVVLNEKTRECAENPVKKAIEQGKIASLEKYTILVSKSGVEIMIDDSAAPIYGHNNEVLGVVLVFRDVTEARRMEDNHLRAIKLESIGFLAGGIAHDFNNILTTILGNISLAKSFIKDQPEVFSMIYDAEKAAFRAKDLSNQLLTLSKGGSPVISISSIKELLKEATEFALHGTSIACEYSVDANIWNAVCDQGQIIQVMHNLVINARQSMPDGGKIFISCSNFKITGEMTGLPLSEGNYLKISVRDHGIGIPKDNVIKIFDPYFTTKKEGQGIGLTTVYSIIKKHKGYIEVESEVNSGTVFTFYLPATAASVDESRKETANYTGKSLKILILEDDVAITELLDKYFSLRGYHADFTKDGVTTLLQYKKVADDEGRYDFVILDLTIKNGMGGKETIAELLKIDPEVRAVVSSGYSNDSILANYKKYGFKARLSKPFRSADIDEIIKEVMIQEL